jgi:hypothetical protein
MMIVAVAGYMSAGPNLLEAGDIRMMKSANPFAPYRVVITDDSIGAKKARWRRSILFRFSTPSTRAAMKR